MKPNRFYFRTTSIFGAPLKCGAPIFIGFTFLISGLGAHGGDILRGGGGNSNKPGRASSGAPTPSATDAARANARDTLVRTNRTLDAVRAMQNAARNAAIKNGANHLGKNPNNLTVNLPKVPNGLVTGGLQVAPVVATDPTKWTGAKLPTQIVKGGKTQVTIKQTTQQALLNWQSFNVGKDTTVTFDQTKGGADVSKWIAFNKITDPTGNPTQILGKIKADGQVYLINPNGIIFGGSSQVNARGLTVSSLPINENLITRGLLNNPDAQFLFSGLAIPAGINGTSAFTPEAPLAANGEYGDVIVQKGAVFKSPTNAAKTGGHVSLVGPNIFNDGTITTPDGQTILAAGLQVGFEGHASADATLRGLNVFVGAVGDSVAGQYAGTVKQGGIVESERGSIVLAGREIEQSGALVSTTSVSLNGRIDIQANYNALSNRATANATGDLFLFRNSGAVSLGAGSMIRILPEYDSKETTIGTELALRSQINLTGKTIRIGEGSTMVAPNGSVRLAAGSWLFEDAAPPRATFLQAGGQVYMEEDAVIDVAGSLAVSVPVSQNIVSVDLRGAELADSPLQREGNLRNKAIEVDIRDAGIYQGTKWIGTPLANIAGFANLIQRSVGQLTVAGGTVSVSAGKSVVMQGGSKINVSGGSTRFEAGMVRTTQLITNGRLVDISQALPDVAYDGIFDGTFTESNVKFGITNVYHSPLAPDGYRLDPGSTEGGAGGKLSISAPSMALDGRFLGHTITGEKQRLVPPTLSTLNLAFQAQDTTYPNVPIHSPAAPTITFDSRIKQSAPEAFTLDSNGDPTDLTEGRKELVVLSPELLGKDGFGILNIDNHDGKILVPEGVSVEAPTGGSITFKASSIVVNGSVTAHGGSLAFSTFGLTLDEINLLRNNQPAASPPVVQAGRGIFTLGSTGVLSATGLIVDDRQTHGPSLISPVYLGGGSIKIEGYSADLAAGGLVDVSGGALIGPTGGVSYGSGGAISIGAGRELGFSSTLGGKLNLGSDLQGLSGGKAGSLSILGPAIQIGGTASQPDVTLVGTDFFSQGGFGTISLTGIGLTTSVPGAYVPGVQIVDDVEIRPVVDGWLGSVGKTDHFKLTKITREEGVRTPVNLTFGAIGANYGGTILSRGDVVVGEGSQIVTDGKGSVSFNAETITLRGSVISPGGNISVEGLNVFPADAGAFPTRALPTVHLASTALLSTRGKVTLVDNPFGLRQGQVLAGGSINVVGNIVAEAGAVLDVSGTSGILDLAPSSKALEPSILNSLGGKQYVPVTIESNAGAITLAGSEMLFTDATLIGKAGGKSATGGTLNVSSGHFIPNVASYTTADANLVVTMGGITLPETSSSIGVGKAVLDADGDAAPQLGYFSVDEVARSGFDSLSLGGNVRFDGDVSITLPGHLSVASGGVIYAKGDITLTAGHVSLGQAFRTPSKQASILFDQGIAGTSNTKPYYFGPSYGAGSLTIRAGLIDVGDLSLQGIGHASLLATTGDVRGNGTFQMAGDLVIKAGQIYPPTQREFTIFAYDHASVAGSVSIRKGDARSLPFSAGGTLSIYASEINQDGTLRAPIGTINLGWDGTGSAPLNPIAGTTAAAPVTAHLTIGSGSVTSVSAIDPITNLPGVIPYGISFDGSSWIDPAGNDITVAGAPEKRVNLAAVDLKTEKGSVVDIRGGGDLYAYRWISGNGGTKDVLASTGSFAVIPGYGFDYAPYAPFNSDPSATQLEGQPGYTNSLLKAGDQITLAESKDLPAGTYTLLPARFALLPGAFLVTPQGGSPVNTSRAGDGSRTVSGYRSNNLDENRTGATVITRFEIASAKIVRERSEYQDLLANKVLKKAAITGDFAIPRLPIDSGYLSFSSTVDMTLGGDVRSLTSGSGRGGLIDINSSSDILVNNTGTGGTTGQLVLKSSQLNNFHAESLLIGGLREQGPDGAVVTVNTDSLEIDNDGASLKGADIILVSSGKLTLAKKSKITATGGKDSVFDNLTFGDDDVAGSGNGTLVRVTSNTTGGVTRFGVSASGSANLRLLSGTNLTGGGVLLDSTAATRLSSSADLNAEDVSLSSGQISILLGSPGKINPTTGLVLSGDAFDSLQSSAKRLSLLSYSSLDVYGKGTVGTRAFESLSLQASSIRGFNTGAGSVKFTAASLILGNSNNAGPGDLLAGPLKGSLEFDADNITLGSNTIRFDGYEATKLSASSKILLTGEGGIHASGNLGLVAGVLTGESASKYRILADGQIQLTRSGNGATKLGGAGFGADVTLQGSRVKVDGDITLASGRLTLHALSGDVEVGNSDAASIDLAGTAATFVDAICYTSGGTVNLVADNGSVKIGKSAVVSVSAMNGGGNAGAINVKTPHGRFLLNGAIRSGSGSAGLAGSFTLDSGVIAGRSLASLDAVLNTGNFTQSRQYRIRTGDVKIGGSAKSHIYQVSADAGDIIVSGTVNASGNTGGTIDLKANGSLILKNSAVLNASGKSFDSAGKGGSVVLEAGNQSNGEVDANAMLDLRSGSLINLSVAAQTSASESLGMFSGTLHLRAPRNAENTDMEIKAIGSSISGASSILVEGVKLYGITGVGTITTAIQTGIRDDATAFLGAAGTTTDGYTAMLDRLTLLQPSLDLILAPGAEIYNTTGDLVLGTTTSNATSDWNLQTFRFGAKSAPGVLTLRAKGDIVFYNALSDGFAAVPSNVANGQSSLWLAPLMARNNLLAANSQSWSYRFTSGADLSSADFHSVLSEPELTTGKGSFLLGKNYGNAATFGSGASHTTARSIAGRYQVIRTGSGDISINSARDARILNQFASIYSAGTVVSDPTRVITTGDFVVPVLLSSTGRHPNQGSLLGAVQQQYYVQYSMAGGNISIRAEGDIAQMTRNTSSATGGVLIDDSSRQLASNWLYRRGYIDPVTGESGVATVDDGSASLTDPNASTTWWVDFSNFFEGVATLGGGNVTLSAGNDVKNVDASAPTNARMSSGKPSASKLVELGGGDVTVLARRNIDGGVYYVERGHGLLNAGNEITTNSTRSPSRGIVESLINPVTYDSNTWLPTTLLVGKGGFDVQAGGDLLMGPVANVFSLPQGLNNKFWYKTYFNTYNADSYVNATSLGGSVTHRTAVTFPAEISERPALLSWILSQQSLSVSNGAATFQPWLRLAETDINPFKGLTSLMPPKLTYQALGGSINLTGDLTLFPSSVGNLELFAKQSIVGLQPTGLMAALGVQRWITSTVNVSDSDPAAMPGVTSPYAYLQVVGTAASAQRVTGSGSGSGFLDAIDSRFRETGTTAGALEEEQARHTQGQLHKGDSNPIRIYALDGNIEGLNLYSPKVTRVSAGLDIGDIGFYLQNGSASDVSVVSAGRDLTLYDTNTVSRAFANGSVSSNSQIQLEPLAGDIQISGPGNLQVLAGRNLDLGLGSGNADGTGSGITSIGNGRNPYLATKGAGVTVGAGIEPASSLSNSSITFDSFITDFVETEAGAAYLKEIAPGIDFAEQSPEEQARLALEVFYLTLRDTGRDFNDPESPGYRKYDNGFAAIQALFPKSVSWEGEILTQSRDIRTRSGGDINILAPGGGLTMANTTIGNPLTPPGIVTESGGDISIFTKQSVDIGIGRIFTLRGGNAVIWSSKGDIAAGSSSRTVSAAPPTRVLIDPQSASVETDLAGLATGGGIGVLATVEGVKPGDVDLIAPTGIIDAGDAGIRVSGNINLAAVTVVNAGNISAGGSSTGAPSTTVSAPSISTVTSASNSTAAANSNPITPQPNKPPDTTAVEQALSFITVEVIGYGGGGQDEDEEEKDKDQAL